MWSKQAIPLLAGVLLAAVTTTSLFVLFTLAQIEEPWNIVVASEASREAKLPLIVAVAHAFLLGLPLFFFLQSKGRNALVHCMLGGFLVGATPFAVVTSFSLFIGSASTGGVPTVVDGVPTLAGLIEYLKTVGFVGLFGVPGGLTFWLVMRFTGGLAIRPNESFAEPGNLRGRSWSLASIAGIAALTLFFLPTVVKDRSCHNLFRDGRTSVGPQISANLKLANEDWPTLTQIFTDFGSEHALSLRSDEQIQRGELFWHSLSLCNEAGVTIQAIDQIWLRTHTSWPLGDRGIQFDIYELKAESGWNPLAQKLLAKIDTIWPDRTTFRGPDGRVQSLQDALKGRN